VTSITDKPGERHGARGDPATAAPPPAAVETPLPKKRRKRKLPKVVSRSEAQRLVDAARDGTAEGTRDAFALALMYRAGLRVSEVVKLTVRDFHVEDGVIDVRDAKGGDGTAYFAPDQLLPLYDRWMEVRAGWATATSPLVCKRDGSRLSTRYLQRLVKRLKEELGIDGVCTPHVLRHSFATELLEDGFTLSEVQAALRHAHLQTTAVYLHVRDKALQTKMSKRGREVQ
jgi:integrase/recombinase XerD